MPTYNRLTDRALATGVTLNDLIHIVITGDTSQNAAGSSYKAKVSQLVALISGSTGSAGTSGTSGANGSSGSSGSSGLNGSSGINGTSGSSGVSGTSGTSGGGSGAFLPLSGGTVTGNTYFGTTSGITIDQANSRIGIGTLNPTNPIQAFVGNTVLNYSSSAGGVLDISGSTNLPRMSATIAASGGNPLASVNIGMRAWTDATYPGYGKVGDGHLYASNEANGLNIINRQGTGTEDYIRFYAGQDANGTIPDIHIAGTGSTRGYVGIGGVINPDSPLHVSGRTKTTNFQMTSGATAGYILVSDSSGNAIWSAATIGAGGSSGSSGSSGINGTSGTNGSSGISGSSGVSGTNGTSGSSGINGTNGTSGSSGVNGTNGTSGTSGLSGIDGALSGRWEYNLTGPIASGDFMTNSIDFSGITTIRISKTGATLNDYTTFLVKMAASTTFMTITKIDDNSIIGSWDILSVSADTDNYIFTTNNTLVSNGSLQNNIEYSISFSIVGASGSSGSSGINGSSGSSGTSGISGIGLFLPLSGGTVSGNTLFNSGFTANTIYSNYIDFNTGATVTAQVARLRWNDAEETGGLEVGMKGGNVTLQIGEENLARVYNADSVPLTDGMVVYVFGNQGNTISVKRASATGETTSARVLGMVTETIAVGDRGFVNTYGLVRDLDTSAYTGGTPLYLGTTLGSYTSTQPDAPNHICLVGFVSRSHATTGSIFIHVSNGWELDELHNVLISGVTNGDLLSYNSSDSTWRNTKTLNGSYTITGNTIVQGGLSASTVSATTISANTIGASANCVTDLYVTNIHSCSPLNINPFNEGDVLFGQSNQMVLDLTNKRVGFNKVPSFDFDFASTNGTFGFKPSSTNSNIQISGTSGQHSSINFIAGNSSLTLGTYGQDLTSVGFSTGDTYVIASQNNNNLQIITVSGTTGQKDVKFKVGSQATNSADFIIKGSGTTRGFVGIGTENPDTLLHISGNTKISGTISATTISATTITSPTTTSPTISATTISATTMVLSGSNISSSWTSYTPTWTSNGTQPVLGNGNISGSYKVIGKTCFVRARLALGTTSSGGTGHWLISLPLPAANSDGIQFPCSMLDNGNAWYQGTVNGTYAGETDKSAIIVASGGGASSSEAVTSIKPFTWGAADSLQFNGSYEIA